MSSLRVWRLRFAGLFGKERKDRELAEELESHLRMHIEENVRAGMSPGEARRNALIRLGGMERTKERYRELRGIPSVESLLQDVRFGARMLRKSPGFTIVAVLTLALGIGANTTIFSFVNGTLLQPLPLPNPEQIVELWEVMVGHDRASLSVPNLKDWQDQNDVLQGIAAYRSGNFNVQGPESPERISGAYVTANFFNLLQAEPVRGRGFALGDDTGGHDHVAVISAALWNSVFGGRADVLGRDIRLNSERFTIVGVMPATFRLPNPSTQVWVPFVPTPTEETTRGMHVLNAVGRLKDGVSIQEAQAQMSTIARRIASPTPRTLGDLGAVIKPLQQVMVEGVRASLLILFAAAALVFLIVCANVLNLLLTRAAGRQKEIAVRATTGATRPRLLRQFLTENLLLSSLGGGFAWILARWGTRLLVALRPENLPGSQEIRSDARVLPYTLLLLALAAVILGFATAIRAARINVQDCLKEGSAAITLSHRQGRAKGALAIAQIAGALVLTIGALLLVQSFWRLLQVNPGLEPERVLTMRLSLPAAKYSTSHPEPAFYGAVLEKVNGFPQVQASGLNSHLPIQSAGTDQFFLIEGRPELPLSQLSHWPDAEIRAVSPGFFPTLRIPLVRGRYSTEHDDAEAPLVLLINEVVADRFFPNEDPVGKRLRLPGLSESWLPIVGVVGNTRQFGLAEPARPEIDVPYLQAALFPPGARTYLVQTMSLAVRTAGDPTAVANAVREAIRNVDPEQPVYDVETMQQVISDSVASRRFDMFLLVAFAVLALGLAALGIYGVISYGVRQRTQEIGIRVALGARQFDVLRMVIGSGMRLALIGVSVGIAGALAVSRFLSSLLYGVKPTDLFTFVAVTFVLLGVALLACYIPARQATKVDPLVALRFE